LQQVLLLPWDAEHPGQHVWHVRAPRLWGADAQPAGSHHRDCGGGWSLLLLLLLACALLWSAI